MDLCDSFGSGSGAVKLIIDDVDYGQYVNLGGYYLYITFADNTGDNWLEPGESHKIKYEISYTKGSGLVDEPVILTFAEISLVYKSVQTDTEYPE